MTQKDEVAQSQAKGAGAVVDDISPDEVSVSGMCNRLWS